METDMNITADFLKPEQIVAGFGLKKGDHVADFGAGHGYFALALAAAVGREGKVWAVDIQPSALDTVRSSAMSLHALNIEYVRADLEAPDPSPIPERFMDFVLVGNILFQVAEKENILREARRVLRERGRMAMIEWDAATNGLLGPPAASRIKKQDAKALALSVGFEIDREFAAGTHHYGLLFKRP